MTSRLTVPVVGTTGYLPAAPAGAAPFASFCLNAALRPLMGSRADFGAHQQAAGEMQDRVAAFEARHHDVLRDAARWFPMIGKSGDWLPESFPEFGTSLVTWIPAFQNLERA